MQEDNIKETPEEEVQGTAYWQWIKGDESGSVVTIKEEDSKWITFDQGGRLAAELKSEFLQSLDSDIAGEFVKTQNAGIDPLNIGGPLLVPTETPLPVKQITEQTVSPIRVLFNKQKKNSKVKLLLEFPVNIPSKAIYELMSTSFDSTEVNEQLYSFILDQLAEDEILDCLKDSIKSLIQSKYKGE